MQFVKKITELVAGQTIVDKAEELALIRKYEKIGAEEYLRQVRDNKPEPRLPEPIKEGYPYDMYREARNRPYIKNPYTPAKPRADFLDCYLTDKPDPVQEEPKYITPSGPPDITAIDLTEEQWRRVYFPSEESGRIAMPLCHGIGRYRTAISADPEQRLEVLRKSLSILPPELIIKLSDTEIAETDPVAWQMFMDEIENKRLRSEPGQGFTTQFVDPETGTRVTTGFISRNSSSIARELQVGQNYIRKDSGLALGSSASDSSNLFGTSVYRRSVSRHRDPMPQGVLETITETQDPLCNAGWKIARPCIFGDSDDPESAIASSDDVFEEVEEEGWADVVEVKAPLKRHSALTQMIQDARAAAAQQNNDQARPQPVQPRTTALDQSKPRAMNRTGLERGKGPKGSRPQFRRSHSRKISTISNVQSKTALHVSDQGQLELPEAEAETSECSQGSQEDFELLPAVERSPGLPMASSGSGIWMKGSFVNLKSEPTTFVDASSAVSQSSALTMVADRTKLPGESKGRVRSNTAFRISQTAVKQSDEEVTTTK